jgi:phosphatidylinositol alpha-mannosyltransferase
LDHFNPDVKPVEKFCDGKLNILFVGRLEKRRALCICSRLIDGLKKSSPIPVDDCRRVRCCGRDLKRKYCKWHRRCCILGNVSYEDLPCYYKTADVFCAPAIGQESFGIILLEAMAVGTPIVATNIAGYASV